MFVNPTPALGISPRISSPYGSRTNPVTGQFQSLHNGIDIPGPEGTPVVAMAAGTVVSTVANDPVSGNWIGVDHGNGYTTQYLHLYRIDVVKGSRVAAGQQIGLLGTTGRSTGPHLHLIVKRNGSTVDPYPLISWVNVTAVAAQATSNVKSIWLWSGVATVAVLGLMYYRSRGRR